MAKTQWLYNLIAALDRITDEAQAVDEVPNVKEWVEEIRREERERCAVKCDKRAQHHARVVELAVTPTAAIRQSEAEFCSVAIREQEVDDG